MRRSVFYFIFILQVGCLLPRKALPDDFSKSTITLPLFIEDVMVIDNRKDFMPMDWDVKALTLKNQTYEGNPELSAEHISAIKQIFKNASTPEATPAKVIFYLETGYCIMKHHYVEQSSLTKVKGKVIIDVYPRDMKYNGYAELQYTYEHPSVSKDHILQMYDINIKNVSYNILEMLKNELDKSN